MKKDDQLFPLLEGLEPPEPPPGLRQAVLDSALEGLTQPPSRDLWDLLWHSSRWRLAWACCVVALIAGHLALTLQSRRPSAMIAHAPVERDETMATASVRPLRLDVRPVIGAREMPNDDLTSSIYPQDQTQPRKE